MRSGSISRTMCAPRSAASPSWTPGGSVYSFTILAHMKYRKSADFAPDGFKMPAYKILDPICLAFFIFMYITLLIGEETRIVALVGLTWFGVFSTVCYFIYERKQKVNPDPTSIGK